MTPEEIKKRQEAERKNCLQAILDSKANRKLIVAGAGTGKTFTFGKVLELRPDGNNLAMTFIKKLVAEMEGELGNKAKVKTFHAFCKGVLHARNGKIELVPYLSKVIEKDAELLGKNLENFETKFRTIQADSPEVTFYLQRGDYYEVVGFDDSVFRLYGEIKADPKILPSFDQVVVDEFQDFNPLEVAFIGELAKKGNILIVGDDDQAIYDDRSASPSYLRKIYTTAGFEKFNLPFCSRCPQVIVTATNCIIQHAQQLGHFKGRIPKRYECYLSDKEADSAKYPKIVFANCTTAAVVPKYIQQEIAKITPDDIADSRKEGKEYPTVLIVGTKQYLREVEKYLRIIYPQMSYAPSAENSYGICEAYECLLRDERSNLGWRILAEFFLDESTLKKILETTETGTQVVDLVAPSFVTSNLRAVELLRSVQNQNQDVSVVESELRKILGADYDTVIPHFTPQEEQEKPVIDKSKPTILLTSYKGCKGLSAGHVFIIGAHNGSMPRDANVIKDVEISQFIVALTRTRKQCHIVSNNWLVSPYDKKKQYVPPFERSVFVSWIPTNLIENKGKIDAKSFLQLKKTK